jgi:phosphoribosylanthranilate isomerase
MSGRRCAVKVCGMRDPDNVRGVTALKPDYIGFIFAPASKRFVGDCAPIARDCIPSDVRTIGVFVNDPVETIARVAETWMLDGVQLHGAESPETAIALKKLLPGTQVWKALSIRDAGCVSAAAEYAEVVDLLVFDNGGGGSGASFDWSVLSGYRGHTPFLVAGGIGAGEAALLRERGITKLPLFHGIDINSKVESCPGTKDIALVRRVIEEVMA